jgi:hypothetical protein
MHKAVMFQQWGCSRHSGNTAKGLGSNFGTDSGHIDWTFSVQANLSILLRYKPWSTHKLIISVSYLMLYNAMRVKTTLLFNNHCCNCSNHPGVNYKRTLNKHGPDKNTYRMKEKFTLRKFISAACKNVHPWLFWNRKLNKGHGCGGNAPHILSAGSRWRWIINLSLHP